jgi:hypothetical protein
MRKYRAFIAAGAGFILASLLSGCVFSPGATATQAQYEGVALLKISFVANSPFSKIAESAVLTVSAPDMLKITQSLSITDSSVEGFVKGIPAGKHRLFEVSVFDSLEKIQYTGSAYADVFGDSTVLVSISLTRVNGNAIINGKVIESGPVTVSDSGLVAFWPFETSVDNTYIDATGHGYDAYSPGLTVSPGIVGNALDCPGGNFELIVKNSKDQFDFNQFTIETWLYTNVDCDSADRFMKVFDYQNVASGVYNSYSTHIDAEGKFIFGFDASGSSWVTVTSNTTIRAKRWYHIACVYDGAYLKIYINGVLDRETAYSGSKYTPAHTNARIGCQTLSGGTVRYQFYGKLDEMKLYGRALPAQTIAAHYNAARG